MTTMDDTLRTLLGSVYTWITLYFTLRLLNPGRSPEWHCRVLTVVHAILVSVLGIWCAFVQGPWPLTDAGGPTTPLQAFTIAICLGYFLFDMTWCLWYQTEGPVMLMHHGLSILGMSSCLLMRNYGTELVTTICGSELSNPLLQTRWFLRETGNYESVIGEIVDLAFVISFGFLRIGLGSYVLFSYFKQPTDYLGRFGGCLMYSVGWVFWISIMQYAVKKYRRKWKAWNEAKTKKVMVDIKERTENDGVKLNKAEIDDVITKQAESTNMCSESDDITEENCGSDKSSTNINDSTRPDTGDEILDHNKMKEEERKYHGTGKSIDRDKIHCNGTVIHDNIEPYGHHLEAKTTDCDIFQNGVLINGYLKSFVDKKNA